jgi:hypothetical protein
VLTFQGGAVLAFAVRYVPVVQTVVLEGGNVAGGVAVAGRVSLGVEPVLVKDGELDLAEPAL